MASRRFLRSTGKGLLTAALATCPGPPSAATDLSSYVGVSLASLRRHSSFNTVDVEVTVRNTGAYPVTGPLQLVLTGGQPADVALSDADGRTVDGYDFVEVPLTDGLLEAGRSAVVMASFVSGAGAMTRVDFRVDGTLLTPATSRELTVTVLPFNDGEEPQDDVRFEVEVDRYPRGVIDLQRGRSLRVAKDATSVGVRLEGNPWGGVASIPEPHDIGPITVRVPMDEAKEIDSEAKLRIAEVSQRILQPNRSRITLRPFRRGRPFRFRPPLLGVLVVDGVGAMPIGDLTPVFRIDAEGTLSTPAEAIYKLLSPEHMSFVLEVNGQSIEDPPENYFVARTDRFVVARAAVAVQLRAPPSDPMLPIDGVLVVATLMNSDVRVVALTDASGRASLPDLPLGQFEFRAERTASGIVHRGEAIASVDRDALVELTMLAPTDRRSGVSKGRVVPRADGIPRAPSPAPGSVETERHRCIAGRDAC